MTTETAAPRSRRQLLTAALGAGVATLASAFGRPSPAAAADGNIVLVGGEYTASSVTRFDTQATGMVALQGHSAANVGVFGSSTSYMGVSGFSSSHNGIYGLSVTGNGASAQSTSGYGVYGKSSSKDGVYGLSSSGYGVRGMSTSNVGVVGGSSSGYGVHGSSFSNHGVYGYTAALSKAAVIGVAGDHGTGVLGYSGFEGDVPAAPPETGVYGYSAVGWSPIGVFGSTTKGHGLHGYATSGTAGYFATPTASGLHTGKALRAIGRVQLDNCSGVATIAVGAKTVVVTPGIDLVPTSAVVATLMDGAGGTTTVHRVAVNATTNTFTIVLTANNTAASPVKVAWHVFG